MKLLSFLLSVPLLAQSLVIDSGSPSDQFFVGGANDFTISYSGVTGDTSLRYGAFSYHIPSDPGVYLVTLNLRETGTVTAKGQRVFSVRINGQIVIDKMDLFAEAGLQPRAKNYVEASNNGFIDIDFSYSVKSAIVSSIEVKQLFSGPGVDLSGVGMSHKVAEPVNAGTQCQPGDWSTEEGPTAPPIGARLFLCVAGTMRRFRADIEPWVIPAVADLGGVLQMETGDPTLPPVFYFRTQAGVMIGPFTFTGPGPVPVALKSPQLIQPFPRMATQ